MSNLPIDRVLNKFPQARHNGDGWMTRCPAHEDKQPSLSIHEASDKRVLIHCHAGCSVEEILARVRLKMYDLFPQNGENGGQTRGEGHSIYRETSATAQPSDSDDGCTLAQYASAKKIPPEFLQKLGLKDFYYDGQQALRIPYFNEQGDEGPVRFRIKLSKTENGDARFKWRKGSKPTLYGLWRLNLARKAGFAVRVEGESDCHTGWYHNIPAFGIPGASNWQEQWADFFDDIPVIYDIVEPDKGGEAWLKKLSTSRVRDKVQLVRLANVKDLSELHCSDPAAFLEQWRAAIQSAIPWTKYAQAEAKAQANEAWVQCEHLARQPRILDHFAETLKTCGVVGEARIAKIIFLAMTSRFLPRPISIVVKGPSSGGKSYVTERVLSFFPDHAYYSLSAMSERALAYSDEPLSHKFLVICEAAGLRGEFATYLVRSLLSEGCLRYETVEKTPNGMKPRLIQRDGPTGLIVTTTNVSLHPENETRMFSLTVIDTPEQTRRIMLSLADEKPHSPDLTSWHALQTWLEHGEHRVTIPYATALADKIPPIGTRLRRDFTAILNLIRSHALLHQAQRKQDDEGRVIATLEDYEIVRGLVADLLAEGLDANTSSTLRETLSAVRELTETNEVTNYAAVARKLGLDKATALRRVRVAIEKGFVRNLEDRKGREARLVCGEPMPDDVQLLPLAKDLMSCVVTEGCSEHATDYAVKNQQNKSSGCRVAEVASVDAPLAPPPIVRCVDCNSKVEAAPEYEPKDEPLCAGCAANRVVFKSATAI
jgi:hypothetical protein